MERLNMTFTKIGERIDNIKPISEEKFNKACEDYGKILNITSSVENNLMIMGIDYQLRFGISSNNEIVFDFTRNGIQCTRVRFSLLSFRALPDEFLIEQIMRCLLMDLSDWRDVINTLQQ